MPIINSLLDTDFYKLTMMQAILHQFPSANVEYEFRCRNKNVEFTIPIVNEIQKELEHLCSLRFTDEELEYLSTIPFLKKDFIDFIRLFKLDYKNIVEQILDGGGKYTLRISGSWLHTILFEVPVLAIINEVYFKHQPKPDMDKSLRKVKKKLRMVEESGITFVDFGTRRRYSYGWHDKIMRECYSNSNLFFIETSNVHFAMLYNFKPIGTMAHEWFMAGQALGVQLKDSQSFMLQKWADEYRGDLGIALTDVIGVDAFLKDFDKYFAKLYDGVRHDSGDPIEFGDKIINHYKNLDISPKTKTIVFSDGLDFKKANELRVEFEDDINVAFGIGTNFTNDMEGISPISIVMKMTKCNDQPVAKISDSKGKTMCTDTQYVNYLKKVFKEK